MNAEISQGTNASMIAGTLTVEQALNKAVAQHHDGQLQEAGELYRDILQSQPNHPEANHNMGVLAVQMKQPASGLPYFIAALDADPARGQFWVSYIDALFQAGQLEDARQVLALAQQQGLQGDDVNALAARLEGGAQLAEQSNAEDSPPVSPAAPQDSQKKPKTKPAKPDKSAKKSAPHQEKNPSPQEINTLVAVFNQGRYTEAANLAQAMTVRFPLHEFGWKALGMALKQMGRSGDALAPMQKAAALSPGDAETHSNLGVILDELGCTDAAEAGYRRALQIKPDYADAHVNLGAILNDLRRFNEAEASYRRALEITPDFAEAHSNLGNTLKNLGRLDEAEVCLRRALQFKPGYAQGHINLGNLLNDLGRIDEAEACYRRALQIKPNYENAFSNLLFTLNYHPDKSGEEIFEAYREYNARFGLPCQSEWRSHENSRQTQRRLKVGYVSPDFRKHPVRHFLEPLLAHHDKTQVEVYAYADLVKEDYMTARYRGYVDHWVPARGMSNVTLAERIRSDGIDILVELAGHTAGNRLPAFARKPAPVSLSWLGYGCTTGLSAIDYFLTNWTSAPPGSEGLFSEKPWRLAIPPYVYQPAEGMGLSNPLPAMSAGYVTFGTLSRGIRINHRVIRVWSEILRHVKSARLVIDSQDFSGVYAQNLLAEKFAAYGIGRDQLQIGSHSPPWDMLRSIDIGLDCFPHNSGTTLFETLYMGVPYITLAARPSVGRIGSSILEGVGHSEWIADTEDEYVEKAVSLAGNLSNLAILRGGLRQEMEAGPLMDAKGFASAMEAAYREMFEIWAKG